MFFLVTGFILAVGPGRIDAATFSDTPTPPQAPCAFLATSDISSEQITLSWENVSSVDGYYLYRSTSPNGSYTLLDKLSSFATEYTDWDVHFGVKYYYKIVAYISTFYEDLRSPEVFSNEVSLPLGNTTLQAVTPSSSHALDLTWTEVPYADGYDIYRSEKPDGNFQQIHTFMATISSSVLYSFGQDLSTLTYTDKNLTLGKTYYYKVCPFVSFDGQKFSGNFSNIKYEIVRIDAVKITKSSSKKKSTNTITWKKVSEADGYIVYFSKKYEGSYTKLKTINNKNTTTYTHKKLKNGTAYYYKIVAYKNISGNKLTGIVPEGYLKYCDYYSYADESYESRYNRIFGKRKKGYYSSSSKAKKNMKTFKVKVWDINSHGKKYKRSFYLTVHKNIAPSVKQMFQEIYKSKERFPIHDIGCFSWRGKNSNSEHCIGLAFDINANENYMIQGKKILAGSVWKPKKNKYSIPLKCDLVRILEKYGFSRGLWGDRKDYMHFSYFGT